MSGVSAFRSLTEQIDTTTSGGKLIFHVFGALAEFERDLIRERTQAGLAAARARGRLGGRPKKLDTPGKVAMARALYADHQHSIADICRMLGVSRATLYRYWTCPSRTPQRRRKRERDRDVLRRRTPLRSRAVQRPASTAAIITTIGGISPCAFIAREAPSR